MADRLDAALAAARPRGAAAMPLEAPADQLAIEALVLVRVAGDAVCRALRLVRTLKRSHGHHPPVEAADEFLRATELSLMEEGSRVCAAELHLETFLGRVPAIPAPRVSSLGSGVRRRVAERRRGRTTGKGPR